MDAGKIQLLLLGIGSLLSLYGMFRNIRLELRNNYKNLQESKLAEERRIMAFENRLNLLEERIRHYDELINVRLQEINARLDLLASSYFENIFGTRNGND